MRTFHFTYELELTATAPHPVGLISAQGYWWHTAEGLQRRKRKVSLPIQLLLGPPDKAETPLLPEVKMNFWRLMCKAFSFLLLQPHTLFPISDLLWEVSYRECQKARLDDGKASRWEETDLSPTDRTAQQLWPGPSLLPWPSRNTSGYSITLPTQPKAALKLKQQKKNYSRRHCHMKFTVLSPLSGVCVS